MEVQQFAGAAGVKLTADVMGDPGSPAVILLHGGGQTRYSWGKLARRLGRLGYHVISLDLRGHGDSGWAPDGDYRLDAFAADLDLVIDQLDQPPVLIGASLGGIASLLTVGESEQPRAKGLVLVDVVPKMEESGIRRIHEFMLGNLDGFATVEEAADAVARYLHHRPQPRNTDGLRKNLRLESDGRYYWHWDPAFMTGDRRPGSARTPERLREAARGVRVPTLLVRGKLSDVVSQSGADDLLELIPDARSVEVADASHMVAGDKNDVFNSAVEDFLAGLFGDRMARAGA